MLLPSKMEENHFIDILIIKVKNKYMVNSLNLTKYKFLGMISFTICFPPNESPDMFGHVHL